MYYSSKVKILLLIIILDIFLLSGCSPKIIYENNYIEGQDHQFYYYSNESANSMAESEDGYYFLAGEYLYFADKATMTPVIVCYKPNCLHNGETDSTKTLYCNAFFQGAKSLFYYEGSLYISTTHYVTNTKSEFLKVSVDGTKRKILFEIDGEISSAALHRGVLYYAAQVWDENGKATVSVNAAKLNGKSKEIYKETFGYGNVNDIICYGNYVYFNTFDITENGTKYKTVIHDILTEETNVLFDNPIMVSTGKPVFIDDKMYYREAKLDFPDMSLAYQQEFIADLDGSNANISFDLGFPVDVNSDGQYLYARDIEWSPFSKPIDEQMLTIYTIDGKVVDSIYTGSFGRILSLIPGGKEHMFLQQEDSNFFRIYYADKSQISTGNLEWKLLFEIEQKKMHPVVTQVFKKGETME